MHMEDTACTLRHVNHSLLQSHSASNPMLESRLSRHIFVSPPTSNASIYSFAERRSDGYLNQAITYLSPSKSSLGGTDLWLICPASKRSSLSNSRKINHYDIQRKKWLFNHKERRYYLSVLLTKLNLFQ